MESYDPRKGVPIASAPAVAAALAQGTLPRLRHVKKNKKKDSSCGLSTALRMREGKRAGEKTEAHTKTTWGRLASSASTAAAAESTPNGITSTTHSQTITLQPAGAAAATVRLEVVSAPGKARGKKQCNLWEYVWGASVCLGELLLSPSSSSSSSASSSSTLALHGLRVLEIGAGSGLGAIAAARAGARDVLATDLVLDALALIERNAALNDVASTWRTAKLDWYNSGAFVEANAGAFDLIVASDVLFMGSSAKPLARLLGALMRPGGLAVVIDPGRHNVDDFLTALDDLDASTERSGELRAELTTLHGVAYDVCVLKQLNVVTVECHCGEGGESAGGEGGESVDGAVRRQWNPTGALASARAHVVDGGALSPEQMRLVSAVTSLSRDIDAEEEKRAQRAVRAEKAAAAKALAASELG